ncbi:MAG: ATP-binding protein [Hyphomonadaceae bacterium]
MLIAAACIGALWFVDTQGQELIDAQERDDVSTQIDFLARVYQEEGLDGAIQAVKRRSHVDRDGVYALRGPGGEILAGNIRTWPAGVPDRQPWTNVPGNGRPDYHAATKPLDSRIALLVGNDNATREAFQSDIIDTVWIAIAIVATTCLGIGILVTALILIRVRQLSEVAARVSAGDYSARANPEAAGGPFGEIARAQNAMLDRIEALVTGLRTITDSLAHDLRTPLSRTRRHIEQGLLADDPAAMRTALEGALSETDTTIATFTALIDISRADAGMSRESMTEVEAGQIVVDMRDLFEPLAEENGVTLTVNPAAVTIPAHKPLLMQAVANLVQNGIKYTPPGGRVVVSVETSDDTVEIIVTDSGPGIPAAKRAEAVRRFRRVVGENAPEGVGLGLAIVDACARLHGGRLVLEDNSPGLRARLVLSRR